tara:strand:- start:308 stop:1048 length:741 start_codon:yes stop_codon:yes gene_type:complete
VGLWQESYAIKMYQTFFGDRGTHLLFGAPNVNEELLCTSNLPINLLDGKRCLVVGGGPSSFHLNDEIYDSYDVVVVCNHFFKNEYLKAKKANIVLLGDEVNLKDEKLLEYLAVFKPAVGFEHSGRRSSRQFINFIQGYKSSFIYLTRYFSRLGYVARGCALARCLGAHSVDFIGMDGFNKQKTKHYFEKDKQPPPFSDEKMFKQQAEVFFRYMYFDLGLKQFSNLGEKYEESIYSGLLEEVKNEEG